MIVSSSILKNAVERYKKTMTTKEKYKYSKGKSAEDGVSSAFASFMVVIGFVFFTLELLVLFFAVYIAITCTKGGPERIVHIILASTLTLPYVLLMSLFNDCAKSTLRGENSS